MRKILAIDSCEKVYARERDLWSKRKINVVKVNSMQKAICKLAIESNYLFIAINADHIDYKPMLPILLRSTNHPVLLIATSYTPEEYNDAMRAGVDFYSLWHEDTEKMVELALTMVDRSRGRRKKAHAVNLRIFNDMVLCMQNRTIHVNEQKIKLTKTEFQILDLLISKPNWIFTYEQIYNAVWLDSYDECANKTIFTHVTNIRNKFPFNIRDAYIDNILGIGYRFDKSVS